MTNASDLIKADHREVEEMFQQFEERPTKELAIKICDELTLHTEAEEEAVYPDLRQVDQELYDDAVEEHEEVDELIERVRSTEVIEDIKRLIAEIQDKVDHHVDDEETEDLPTMQRELGEERMEELGRDFQAYKDRHRPHDAELLDLTKEELYEKAQDADIDGRSDMTKGELLDELSKQ